MGWHGRKTFPWASHRPVFRPGGRDWHPGQADGTPLLVALAATKENRAWTPPSAQRVITLDPNVACTVLWIRAQAPAEVMMALLDGGDAAFASHAHSVSSLVRARWRDLCAYQPVSMAGMRVRLPRGARRTAQNGASRAELADDGSARRHVSRGPDCQQTLAVAVLMAVDVRPCCRARRGRVNRASSIKTRAGPAPFNHPTGAAFQILPDGNQ